MKLTFRLNKRIARNCIGKTGEAEDWVQSLSKYLSDDARLELSVFTNKQDNDASLFIRDNGLEIYAASTKVDMADAIDSVVMQCAVQLIKNKDLRINRKISLYNDDFDIRAKGNSLILEQAYEIVELENKLNNKKLSDEYNEVTQKYVDHLYYLEDLDAEIDRAENQLSVLYHLFESDKDDMLYRDVWLLIDSIEYLQNKINYLTTSKKNCKMNIRDKRYIDNVVDEELHILKLKRNFEENFKK